MEIPPINLIYLKYFCDAVRLKSISQAAKANFVTQSAVSPSNHKTRTLLQKRAHRTQAKQVSGNT